MVLRTLAFILFGLALCLGVFLGWGYQVGHLLYGANPNALSASQVGIQRLVGPGLWHAMFVPLLSLPAWSFPVFIGVVFMIIAAMRPGKG